MDNSDSASSQGRTAARSAAPPAAASSTAAAVNAFHRQLPNYAATPLHSLPALAADIGVGQILLKDESDRFGLPSFKILGASWAVYRALVQALGLPVGVTLDELAAAVRAHNASGKGKPLQVISTTEGNWGRAVARMARYAGDVPCRLYVPAFMSDATQEAVRREGADVRVVPNATYDDCVALVQAEAARDGSLLLMDMGWEGYEEVPGWVVEGYGTMLAEADEQVREATGGQAATHVVVPVGVGSIAHAVTEHYKGRGVGNDDDDGGPTNSHAEDIWEGKAPLPRRTAVLAVEPDTAQCLRASLAAGRRVTVATADTIMCGLNCGTVSATAWPVLQAGVDYSVAVSDRQAHVAVQQLQKTEVDGVEGGVAAGPCGAATLAGLRKICTEARDILKLDSDSVVVLFCTEGPREYSVPIV